jgi:hypothetical protein
MADRIISEGDPSWTAIRRCRAWVQSLGLEPSFTSAPPWQHGRGPVPAARGLLTLATQLSLVSGRLLRVRRGSARRPWRCAAVTWCGAPWLVAAACELRRNRVPWSRCTLSPADVMTEPVAASAAPPDSNRADRTRLCCFQHAGSVETIATGPTCRAPVAPSASDPTPRVWYPHPIRQSRSRRRLCAQASLRRDSPRRCPQPSSRRRPHRCSPRWSPPQRLPGSRRLRSGISRPSRVTALSKTMPGDEPA